MGVRRGHQISWLLWLWVVLHGSGYQRQIIRRTFCNLNCWVIPLSLLLHFIYSMCVSVYVGQGLAHIWRSEDNLWKTVFSFHQMGSRDWFRSEGWQKHLNTWIYLSGLHVCFLSSHRVWRGHLWGTRPTILLVGLSINSYLGESDRSQLASPPNGTAHQPREVWTLHVTLTPAPSSLWAHLMSLDSEAETKVVFCVWDTLFS